MDCVTDVGELDDRPDPIVDFPGLHAERHATEPDVPVAGGGRDQRGADPEQLWFLGDQDLAAGRREQAGDGREKQFGTESKPGNTYYNVYLRLDGPMANVKFRQALSTALDREAMDEVVQAGFGQVTNQPYPETSPYYLESVAGLYKYSLSKAKKLLKESGVPAGTALDIVYPGQAANVEQLRQAEIIKSQWEKLGLTVNLIPAPDTPAILTQYYNNPSSNGFSATIVGNINPVTQVQGRFFAGQFVATRQNSVLPNVEALYLQFQANPSDPKPVLDAVKYMVENAVEIPIAFRNRNLAWDANRIGGPITAPTEVTDNVELAGVYVKKS